ncbi:MAG: hypothetical protein MZV70_54475 [Desulfobacterales bacterium]|nr:hypothetical protein [Desulfobacterales bacterium]
MDMFGLFDVVGVLNRGERVPVMKFIQVKTNRVEGKVIKAIRDFRLPPWCFQGGLGMEHKDAHMDQAPLLRITEKEHIPCQNAEWREEAEKDSKHVPEMRRHRKKLAVLFPKEKELCHLRHPVQAKGANLDAPSPGPSQPARSVWVSPKL